MKKNEEENTWRELEKEDCVPIQGGNFWPFFNLFELLSQTYYEEDIPLTLFFQNK